MIESFVGSGERLENLGGRIRAIVSEEYSFAEDAVLLANFSAPKSGQKLCDLGTGCGIIPLLWCANGFKQIDAYELQEKAADMARRAAKLNGLDYQVICADIRTIDAAKNGRYDLITCNPPYFQVGTARHNAITAEAAARHEIYCTIEDVVKTSARLLKNGGRLCICHRPERLADVVTLLRAYHLEPKRMRLVQNCEDGKPWLLLIEGRLGARPGLEVLPVLMTKKNGQVSDEMKVIYGDYEQ